MEAGYCKTKQLVYSLVDDVAGKENEKGIEAEARSWYQWWGWYEIIIGENDSSIVSNAKKTFIGGHNEHEIYEATEDTN